MAKKTRKRNSLFRKYFIIGGTIIVIGFVLIALTIMVFVANQWWNDKVDELLRNSRNISYMYTDNLGKGGKVDNEEMIITALGMMSDSSISEYFIADKNGKVLYCGDCEDGRPENCNVHRSLVVNKNHIERALDGGFSDYMNDEDFGIGKFVVAVPIKDGHKTVAITFAVEDAVTGLLPYVASISQYMAYAVCFVLLFMLIIIYYLTRGITKPLEDMQEVTRHIAKGEFNYRASEDYKQKDINDFAKQLNKMAYELAIDDESRKSFVANVSHELKTPMTTIGGFIDGILDGTIPPEEEKKYLGVVSNEVKRLARMVVSMLNLSKIESGEVPLSPVEYDIGKQVFETMLSFEKKIYENNIEIKGFEEINNVLIKADRDLVQQVLYNLLDNAVKFTPENGTIHIFASNDGKKTYVKIRNSGAGVAPEEISRIFERFYKVDKSRSYDVKGVGLGLYIVKTIINMHDGEISASSKQGEYTEFAFEIPFDQ
ncbi:MAG: HAMP domain-containing histidine kinase [Clostridia bacterium]|nr:HAMP domain-containing histidine kinase [Clostridia bacterium]MBQ5904629.1 HAMP domain-containing histidine kinase [Clostridia bacterium]